MGPPGQGDAQHGDVALQGEVRRLAVGGEEVPDKEGRGEDAVGGGRPHRGDGGGGLRRQVRAVEN